MIRKSLVLCFLLLSSLALAAAPHAPSAEPGGSPAASSALPDGFVLVTDLIPDILLDIRYYSAFNFVGARIDGYRAPVAVLARPAALALARAAEAAEARGYILRVFDAYRPQSAVAHFVRWAADPEDQRQKALFYPEVDKALLFEKGYIATRSGHSRGSTIDLTLVERATGLELDMGSPFDFFGERSHHDAAGLTREEAANREALKSIMESAGFRPYDQEWWHYTLADEPHPDTYFDFPVQP